MTIPKYDEMYRAFLDCLTDGQPHKSKEVKDAIAEVFHLSDEERAVLLPSGSGPVLTVGLAGQEPISRRRA